MKIVKCELAHRMPQAVISVQFGQRDMQQLLSADNERAAHIPVIALRHVSRAGLGGGMLPLMMFWYRVLQSACLTGVRTRISIRRDRLLVSTESM